MPPKLLGIRFGGNTMKNKQKTLLSFALILAFAILALGVLTNATAITNFDSTISQSTAKLVTPTNTAFFTVVADLGSPLVAITLTVLLAGYVFYKKDRFLACWIILLQFGGSALAEIIKLTIARPRPTHQIIADTGFSFPSGHTFCTTIFVICLLMVFLPRIPVDSRYYVIIPACTWIILVAFSRFYLRDHYPSDVVASLLLATGLWLRLEGYRDRLHHAATSLLTRRRLRVLPNKN